MDLMHCNNCCFLFSIHVNLILTPLFYGVNLFSLGFWVVSSSSENELSDHENHTNDSNELNLTESDVVKSDFDAEVTSILAHLENETNASNNEEVNVPTIDVPTLATKDEPILPEGSDLNASNFIESNVPEMIEPNATTANGISLDTEEQKVIFSLANTEIYKKF